MRILTTKVGPVAEHNCQVFWQLFVFIEILVHDLESFCKAKESRSFVQFGDLYRLVSPYDGKNMASLMYCSEDKLQAVFYWWKLETFFDEHLPKVCMAGLDPTRNYRIKELSRIDLEPLAYEGKVFSGKFLMETGLEIPYKHNVNRSERTDWSSRVLYLVAE